MPGLIRAPTMGSSRPHECDQADSQTGDIEDLVESACFRQVPTWLRWFRLFEQLSRYGIIQVRGQVPHVEEQPDVVTQMRHLENPGLAPHLPSAMRAELFQETTERTDQGGVLGRRLSMIPLVELEAFKSSFVTTILSQEALLNHMKAAFQRFDRAMASARRVTGITPAEGPVPGTLSGSIPGEGPVLGNGLDQKTG